MQHKRTTKEKILAIFFVIILFLIVGGIFSLVSLNNRQKTDQLGYAVLKLKSARVDKAKLDSITIENLDNKKITAKAFLALAVSPNGLLKTLISSSSDQELPIASITKLMSAIVVWENFDLKTPVLITPDYVDGPGSNHFLKAGKSYQTSELFKTMLIASDNDVARLFAGLIGEKKFVGLMNEKAKSLKLAHTHFVNSTGLDPFPGPGAYNFSTTNDLAQLLMYIEERYPSILGITRERQFNFCDMLNNCSIVYSTDAFLSDQTFPFRILGGKTGQTALANKNLALLTQMNNGVFIISIVLGSLDNFSDVREIINHIKEIK